MEMNKPDDTVSAVLSLLQLPAKKLVVTQYLTQLTLIRRRERWSKQGTSQRLFRRARACLPGDIKCSKFTCENSPMILPASIHFKSNTCIYIHRETEQGTLCCFRSWLVADLNKEELLRNPGHC